MAISNCAQDIIREGGGARRSERESRQKYRSHFTTGMCNLIITCEWTNKLAMHTVNTTHLDTNHQNTRHTQQQQPQAHLPPAIAKHTQCLPSLRLLKHPLPTIGLFVAPVPAHYVDR